MPFGAGVPTLDQVLVKSANTTDEYLHIQGPAHASKFQVLDAAGHSILKVDTTAINERVHIGEPGQTIAEFEVTAQLHEFANNVSGLLWLQDTRLTMFRNLRLYEPVSRVEYSTIRRSVDYLILKAEATAIGVLIEDGNLSFVGADKGRLVDDGSSLAMLYGAGPDFGIAVGTCSAGTFHIDVQSDGIIESTTEQFVITDGAFAFPHVTFLSVLATLRTSGDCAQIVGDITSLTTGRLLAIFNDASGGPGGSPVFTIDKNGKILIGNSTAVEYAILERTLTDFIMDSGVGARLSIKSAGVEVIGDNTVSELALGNTTMAPKIPVLTTAQRNALTATTGMIVWHIGPPARAEIYTGAAWVAL